MFSFILHIIVLWRLVYLNKKVTYLENSNPKEIMQLMELYLEDIKEENKQLQRELDLYDFKTEKGTQDNQTETITHHDDLVAYKEEPPFSLKLENEQHDDVSTSLEAQVLHLYHQHVSPSEIAKKLECGQTEVELLIKFHEKSIST